jgi:hypothetical protein
VKHHFANSSTPLKEGAELKAVCGEKVPHAAFAALLDCAVVGYAFSMQALRGMCRKCRDGQLNKRFVYVICNSQELKSREIA